MTEQQRTARIEFVKKLLVANGFEDWHHGFFCKNSPYGNTYNQVEVLEDYVCFELLIYSTHINLRSFNECCIYHNQPLTPLRNFIKLSNQT